MVRRTYKNVNISKSNGAVSYEASIQGIEIIVTLHVRNEISNTQRKNQQNGSNDTWVKSFVILKLFLDPVQKSKLLIHILTLSEYL